jgi:hypothetical protein
MDKLDKKNYNAVIERFQFQYGSIGSLRGKTFSAEVAMIDIKERHYGVYTVNSVTIEGNKKN